MIGALAFGLEPFGNDLVGRTIGVVRSLAGDASLRRIELWNVLALCGAAFLTITCCSTSG